MTRRPDSSHTSPASPRRHDESGVVAPSRVMLVAIVLVAVAAATYLSGLGSSPSEADVASTSASRQAPSSAASDPTGSASSSPSTSAPSSPSASTSPSAKATGKATAKAGDDEAQAKQKSQSGSTSQGQSQRQSQGQSQGQSPAATPQVQRGQVSVSVFNNSSRTGLAARTSDKVKGAGWKVIGTDNWYGSIPEPTVYYPARLKAAAELLAKDAGIDRVKPAVSPMRSDRLTLIVTSSYRL